MEKQLFRFSRFYILFTFSLHSPQDDLFSKLTKEEVQLSAVKSNVVIPTQVVATKSRRREYQDGISRKSGTIMMTTMNADQREDQTSFCCFSLSLSFSRLWNFLVYKFCSFKSFITPSSNGYISSWSNIHAITKSCSSRFA